MGTSDQDETLMGVKCVVCGDAIRGIVAHSDWEGGMCDACWCLTSPITRGWFALSQRNGDAAGWPERSITEHNIDFDVLAAQARHARNPPPPPRKPHDDRRVLVDMSKTGRPRGGYAAQLSRERNRGKR